MKLRRKWRKRAQIYVHKTTSEMDKTSCNIRS